MPDYQKSKVYKIVAASVDDEFADMYIGSTACALSKRLAGHRAASRLGVEAKVYEWMRDIGETNVRIILLENCPCASFEEQRQHEQRWIEELNPSINSRSAYLTREARREQKRQSDAKYYAKNRERLIEYQVEYRRDNLDEVKERQRRYREEHADEIRDKKKRYYEENKEAVQARHAVYRAENREILNQHSREHYAANRENILAEQEIARRAKGMAPAKRYTDEERKAARKAVYKAYRERNKEKVAARKKAWDAKNKDLNNLYRTQRYATDPTYAENKRADSRKRHAAKRAQTAATDAPVE